MSDTGRPRPIRFVFRGRVVEASAEAPTRSVLQWLREDARACGSKEGCAEGDCGACTVIVAELDSAGHGTAPAISPADAAVHSAGLLLRPVNACIRFLPTLDGKALLTVEDLARGGQLHPAQQALVDHHGSQCGFCTPGFAVSLAVSHERQQVAPAGAAVPGRAELADSLAGNLCRCTGYRPILDAAQAMLAQPGPRLPLGGLAELLRTLAPDPPLQWPGLWHAPRSLEALASLLAERTGARLLAGGTDVGLWVTKQMRELGELVWLGDVAELRRIERLPDGLRIGAAVPLEDAWAALAGHWPALAEMGRRFAGPAVRHAGTLVGNLANGSPIGDGAPALIALGAQLDLCRGEQRRTLPLQDFYFDYMKNALAPGEFIEAVRVPLQTTGAGWVVQAHKISKRFDSDISALSAGFAVRLEGDRVAEARLAFGGMAGIVRRAAGAEAALVGQRWDAAALLAAQAALAQDFTPLTDLRASAGYRREVAGALLERLWLSSRADAPVPLSSLSVFAR